MIFYVRSSCLPRTGRSSASIILSLCINHQLLPLIGAYRCQSVLSLSRLLAEVELCQFQVSGLGDLEVFGGTGDDGNRDSGALQ
jgi:hypothetical protein